MCDHKSWHCILQTPLGMVTCKACGQHILMMDALNAFESRANALLRRLEDAMPASDGRKVERGSAILCEHANEVPSTCRCEYDCYCRQQGSCFIDGRP